MPSSTSSSDAGRAAPGLRRVDRRRIALAVGAAVALVAWGTAARPPGDATGLPVEAFWARKLRAGPRFDGVLLGDSRVYRGLAPAEMAPALDGARILNFGFSNAGLEARYLAAGRAKLDPAAPRRWIVVGVTPLALTATAGARNGYLERAARAPSAAWPAAAAARLTAPLAPLTPAELRRMLGGGPPAVRYREHYGADGWAASDKTPVDLGAAPAAYGAQLARDPDFRLDPDVAADLMAAVGAWTGEGIAVFGLRPPTAPAMRAFEDGPLGFDEAATRAAFAAAGGRWIDVDPGAYATFDGSHLRADDARRLSRDVAAAVAALIRPPR